MDLNRTSALFSVCCLALLSAVTGLDSYNCSQIPVNHTKPCGDLNITADLCTGRGCCWNSSPTSNLTQCVSPIVNTSVTTSAPWTTMSPTSSPYTSNNTGKCINYNSGICRSWLNLTVKEFADKPRFVDKQFGVNRTNAIIRKFMSIIEDVDEPDDCNLTELKSMLCQYVVPPCDARGQAATYCREDCDRLFTNCRSVLREVLGGVKVITAQMGISFVHAGLPNCSTQKYSEEYEGKNETCLHFGIYDFSEKPTSESPSASSKAAVIAAVVCGVVALLLIVITVLLVRRRRRLKKMPGRGLAGVTFTAVSMRDRIRAESIRALDQSKVLSLFNPDDVHQYSLDRVEYIRDLGEGNFGQVFQGRAFGLLPDEKQDMELMVAVKTLKEGSSTEMKENFFQEVAMMSMLHHDNIVRLLAVSTEEEPYGMIFEYMDCGDLSQYLRKAGPYFEGGEQERVHFSQDNLLSIAIQVAHGMEHLQDLRFVHRDLATRNCLVGQGLVVKIADFGMSRDVYSSDYYKVEGQAVMPIRWIPPEALLYGKFTVESDIYSYGVLLWEIYTYALQPYYGYTNEEVVDFIRRSVHLGQPDECPDYLYQLMKLCWKRDPSQRPNFTLIIAHLKQEVTEYQTPRELSPQISLTDLPLLPEDSCQASMPDGKQEEQPKRTPVKKQVSLSGYVNVGYNKNSEYQTDEEVDPQQQETPTPTTTA